MREYFSKKGDNSLFVASFDDDTPILRMTDDFITIWEILEAESELEEIDPLKDNDLAHLKPFFEFIKLHKIALKLDEKKKETILKKFPKEIKGSFDTVDIEQPSFEYVAWACSRNGTGPYGAEPSCDPHVE